MGAGLVIFLLLGLSPYFGLYRTARRFKDDRAASLIVLVVGALAVIPAVTLYILVMFFSEPDAQAGLIFLFLPLYQHAFGWSAGAIAFAVLQRQRDRRMPPVS